VSLFEDLFDFEGLVVGAAFEFEGLVVGVAFEFGYAVGPVEGRLEPALLL
jgi:hypothetical protein